MADRYRLERELGAGGMATVYLAEDLKHHRKVAVKVLRPELAALLGATRFLNEIRVTAQLDHPHILTLIDSGEADGVLYYVLPYVRGESVRDRISTERQLSLDEASRITTQVASALDYAHRHGVIHRDVKPENILIQEGEAMLTDFGIALALQAAGGSRLTETGLSLGTPQYMSPEQAAGERNVDSRSDQYSLGCILYEMLTGTSPFSGATVQSLLARHALDPVPSIRTVRPAVPPALERAVLRAMAKVPSDRYPSVAAFATALASQGPASQRTRLRPLVLGAVVAAILGAGLYWIIPRLRHAGPTPLPPARIAVSGFQPNNADPELNAIAQGLTDDLIDSLRQVPVLDVVRPGYDLQAGLAAWPDSRRREMRLDAVLAGSIAQQGSGYRIELIIVDGYYGARSEPRVVVASAADIAAIQSELFSAATQLLREHPHGQTDANASWLLMQRGKQAEASAEVLLGKADSAGAMHGLDLADSLFAGAAQRDPASAAPEILRGQLAYQVSRINRGNALKASPWIDKGLVHTQLALSISPQNADALELLGTVRYWRYLMRLEPDQAKAKLLLDSARADLEASTRISRTQAGAWATLSHLYYQYGDVSSAYLAARSAYEANPYISNADVVLWRLFSSSYNLEQIPDAVRWCAEGARRLPGDVNFLWCQMRLMISKSVPANVPLAWRLADSIQRLTPDSNRKRAKLQSEALVAAALARSGLADSARNLLSRIDDPVNLDPTKDITLDKGVAFNLLGDKDQALKALATYVAANPSAAMDWNDDNNWAWRNLRDDPRYQALRKRRTP